MLYDRAPSRPEGLSPENAELVHHRAALLTASQPAPVKAYIRPSGLGAWEILNKIKFRVVELPDLGVLPEWLEKAAQEIAGTDAKGNERILHICSTNESGPENWSAFLDGREVAQPALPIQDHSFSTLRATSLACLTGNQPSALLRCRCYQLRT